MTPAPLPVDLDVAMRGWAVAARLRKAARRASESIETAQSLTAGEVAAILGTLLGDLDVIAAELDAVEVEL